MCYVLHIRSKSKLCNGTGIGFLGGAIIFKSGFDVKEIKAAAAVWITGAVGLAIATSQWLLGTVVGVVTVLVMFVADRSLILCAPGNKSRSLALTKSRTSTPHSPSNLDDDDSAHERAFCEQQAAYASCRADLLTSMRIYVTAYGGVRRPATAW
jgi:uncharacterized membrane protein YhiD involved in acid resistance